MDVAPQIINFIRLVNESMSRVICTRGGIENPSLLCKSQNKTSELMVHLLVITDA